MGLCSAEMFKCVNEKPYCHHAFQQQTQVTVSCSPHKPTTFFFSLVASVSQLRVCCMVHSFDLLVHLLRYCQTKNIQYAYSKSVSSSHIALGVRQAVGSNTAPRTLWKKTRAHKITTRLVHSRYFSRVEQNSFRQSRFSGVDVSGDADVSDHGHLVGFDQFLASGGAHTQGPPKAREKRGLNPPSACATKLQHDHFLEVTRDEAW